MSTRIPTFWMHLAVKRITGLVFRVLCSWDGHEVELDQDPSTTVKAILEKIDSLKVGDQLQVKGLLVVKPPHLNRQHEDVLRFRLRVHQFKTVNKEHEGSCSTTKSSSSDKSSSGEKTSSSDRPRPSDKSSSRDEPSSSDGISSSDGPSSDDSLSPSEKSTSSSSDKVAKTSSDTRRAKQEHDVDVESDDMTPSEWSSSDSDGFSQEELGKKEVECDPSRKRSRPPSTDNSSKRPKKESKGNTARATGDESDPRMGGVTRESLPFVRPERKSGALAALLESLFRSSTRSDPRRRRRRRGCDIVEQDFTFNGRGQLSQLGEPLRDLHESDLVYSFRQRFSSGVQRVISISTRMAMDEGPDTLIVEESLHDSDGHRACVRQLQ